MKLSVVIPAHATPPDRLARVFAALAEQSLPRGEWEILLVDNASPTPMTAPVGFAGPSCRVLREPRLGAMHARATGVRAARGELIVFVDDDNLLGPDYLEQACALHALHPDLGAFGGSIVPAFATPPPAWAKNHLHDLALRDLGAEAFIRTDASPVREYPWFSPYGAGMVMPRSAVLAYLEWMEKADAPMTDRVGRQLGGCGDTEMVLIGALRRGLGVAYTGRLRLTHLIPAARLRFGYFVRLQFQSGLSWGRFLVIHALRPPETRAGLVLRGIKSLLVNLPRGASGVLSVLRRWGELRGALRPAPITPRR